MALVPALLRPVKHLLPRIGPLLPLSSSSSIFSVSSLRGCRSPGGNLLREKHCSRRDAFPASIAYTSLLLKHEVAGSPGGEQWRGISNSVQPVAASHFVPRRWNGGLSQSGQQGAGTQARGSAGPLSALQTQFQQYREAAGLHLESAAKRNFWWLAIGGGLVASAILWKLMSGVVLLFVRVSDSMVYWGFMSLAASSVAMGALWMQRRMVISPDTVYRLAMRRLRTHPGLLEIMGAPLLGTDVRAYIMAGGNIKFKGLWPRLAPRRCYLLFPLRGSERRALVTAEVKRKKGKYHFKLLAVDLAMSGPRGEDRFYVVGDDEAREGVARLMSELRDPLITAINQQKEIDKEEEKNDEL